MMKSFRRKESSPSTLRVKLRVRRSKIQTSAAGTGKGRLRIASRHQSVWDFSFSTFGMLWRIFCVSVPPISPTLASQLFKDKNYLTALWTQLNLTPPPPWHDAADAIISEISSWAGKVYCLFWSWHVMTMLREEILTKLLKNQQKKRGKKKKRN